MRKVRFILNILIIQVVILLNVISVVYASESANNQISLKAGKELPRYFKYSEYPLETKHVFYSDKDKNSNPSYCLNMDRKGITKENLYSVAITGNISDTDIGLWRVIVNGYPYVSYTNLGCSDTKEAFAATQHAVYLYLKSADIKKYVPVGDEGQRVLNGINTILNNAKNSTETKLPSDLEIHSQNENWEEDVDGKFIYKSYYISAQATFDKYNVEITGLPEGSKITDISGNEKQEFSDKEEFKITIPKELINENLNLKINVKAQVKTNPVYYGKAPNETLQNYAITGKYEEGTSTIEENYSKPAKEETKSVEKTTKKVLPLTGM